ncbi:MAG: 1-acyl-sn-glycerol-3-phosphate acyltransferase [Flavobacteriaceae bacterium]|nr:1-acyl-sn-glycerol-3-phosphate acyltransferase [Flavobacteriaceae bacterium]
MKVISHILSPIFGLVFFILILIFHPLQWLGLKLFGQNGHQKVVDIMCWFLTKALLFLGVTVSLKNKYNIPKNKTIIFVSNHQGMYDIPPLIWFFRKHVPKFVSKKELGKGIPSISFNLKYGGAALIDRKDRSQSIKELEKYSKRINENKWSAVIFPEGTRSRKGEPKKFAYGGLKTIFMHNPTAIVVPITINNSWKLFRYGAYPLGVFFPITFETHEPIPLEGNQIIEVLRITEEKIKSKVIAG